MRRHVSTHKGRTVSHGSVCSRCMRGFLMGAAVAMSLGGMGLVSLAGEALTPANGAKPRLCGMVFNPQPIPDEPNPAWLRHYSVWKKQIDTELRELVAETGITFIDIQILIARTLAQPKVGPSDESTVITDWADMEMMDNVVAFLDFCSSLGIAVEIDLANNMWIPLKVDTANHIGAGPWWPEPDDTPWTESRVWYTQIIEHIESRVRDKNVIAFWCMFGNHHWGGAEPVLWDTPGHPDIKRYTERYVKEVWPAFRRAGVRPKAAPYILPILSNDPYWLPRTRAERLSAASNLKRWIVDDLGLPPDYWPISTYVNSDPAPDDFWVIKGIVDILGPENASRIVSTDFKGPGHDLSASIIDKQNLTGAEQITWNTDKAAAYGMAGWWMWCYRDTAAHKTGIRTVDGMWKRDLTEAVRAAASR